MPYTFYKVLHLTGIFMMVFSLGALALQAFHGGSKQFRGRKGIMMVHGFGMLISFVAGFGLLARTGITWPWPGWVWAKLTIWIFLGGAGALLLRQPTQASKISFVILLLTATAAYLANYKPF